ncbi:MAG: phosphatidylglycerol lysyltransferase domain-containing protein [Deltaproteobacteria bacterium]|nr:phosphatidylglycerol lysyltransferase domain-containing protein [Deltaproteobacteria bacterium]
MGNSSPPPPVFPDFKPLGLEDRDVLQRLLWDYQPETSELTFTNLFIWREFYQFSWCLEGNWLLMVSNSPGGTWALPPIGPPPRATVCRKLLKWAGVNWTAPPCIARADDRLVTELAQSAGFLISPLRDHFDYVYRSQDLIQLPGSKYQAQRTHTHQFQHSHQISYEPLQSKHLGACLELAAEWCALKRCAEDLGLQGEWQAVREGLRNFQELNLVGGVILVKDKVEAFTVGELLNRGTAVVHIEKANPAIPGIYAVINQEFCRHSWSEVPFINREQDLGLPGLRMAKMSYHPHRLVEKFRIQLA